MSSKKVCSICGKRAKRFCPALDTMICSLCCGKKRGEEIECSPECRFSPFAIAGYNLWLKIDGTIMPKIIKRVVEEVGSDYFQEEMESLISFHKDDETVMEYSLHTLLNYFLLVEKDTGGRTLAERWEAEGWEGLDSGEAQMMRYRTRSFLTVIEIQKILDHQRLECIDIFDPDREPFILLDRSLASRVVRFARFFGWVTHYPNFSRPGVVGHEIPHVIRHDFIEIIVSQCQEVAGRTDEEAIKEFLALNQNDLTRLLWELPREKMRSAFRKMDVHHCTAVYQYKAEREDIEQILEAKTDFRWRDQEPDEDDPPGTDYYTWLRAGRSRRLEEEMPVFFHHEPDDQQTGTIGNIKLFQDQLILETFTRQKYEFAKKMLNKYFGKRLEFQREKVVDLARQFAEKDINEIRDGESEDTSSSAGEIPPEINVQIMEKFYKEHYEKFLQEEIPALNGLTPPQAAADPESRPRLVELMKEHLNVIAVKNRDEGLDIKIDSILEKLGLEELIDLS
ncbi:MAG: zinc finger HIT domain-containing protein [Candidatus Auribacterota bacterium]|nr:zinc finger HIT domain-containing protein [Candidatus Auribacterota bacterium]